MRRICIYLFLLAFFLWLFIGVGCYYANKLIKNYMNKNEMLVEQVKENEELAANNEEDANEEDSYLSNTDNNLAESELEENYPVAVTDNINATLSGAYYLRYINGEIVVYEKDMDTVYMNTGIDASHLSEDVLAKLQEGIWVGSEDELFSVLESYSS